MAVMESDDVARRARQRDLVRRGYDSISLAYRSDEGDAAGTSAEDVSRYAGWVADLAGLLRPGARVLDLGCGAGIPATRELATRGLQVLGVDFSAVQLRRARRLVPGGPAGPGRHDRLAAAAGQHRRRGVLLRPDPRARGRPAGAVPADPGLAAPRRLLPGYRRGRPGGPAPRSSWAPTCSGITPTPGRTCAGSRRRGSRPLWHRYVPDGDSGHTLVLARAA